MPSPRDKTTTEKHGEQGMITTFNYYCTVGLLCPTISTDEYLANDPYDRKAKLSDSLRHENTYKPAAACEWIQ